MTLLPKKRFGQHFLEPAWVDKVIRVIDPKPDEAFIEIGPGRGALTRPLGARAKSVVAYEIDRDLAAELDATAPPNVTVVPCDFLDLAPTDPRLPTTDSRVAGNLPYNAASPILFNLVGLYRSGVPLTDATVMLQREVADRLIAAPGGKEYGVLSVLIQHLAAVERVLALPPGAFRPRPTVRSALVRLRFHPPQPPVQDVTTFAGLVQAVFTRRRKTIANALRAFAGSAELSPAEMLVQAAIDGTRRPETLTIAEFARLADVYSGKRGAVL